MPDQEIFYTQKLPAELLSIWWAFWIFNGISGQVAPRPARIAGTVSEIQISTVASLVDNIIGVALALVTVKMINSYADVEPLLIEISENPESVPKKVDLL